MKRFSRFVSLLTFFLISSRVFAGSDLVLERAGVARTTLVPNTFSVEVAVVTRVQGSAFFRTSIDINNNLSRNGVTATFQYSYTCVSAACNPQGGFYRTPVQNTPAATITLRGLDNFHSDDFIQYLTTLRDGQGRPFLQAGADQGSIGTLLVTFQNLGVANPQGWEGTVVARTYNRIVESDPSQGTVGFAYSASTFLESADTTLVGYARDTKSNPTVAGKLRSNAGVRNTDINVTNQNVTVQLSFYDTATGSRVGDIITFPNLQPGELRQVSDVWTTARIASSVSSIIVFVDNPNHTLTSPTFEGYITIIDGQNTQDAAFFEMKCTDANGCSN